MPMTKEERREYSREWRKSEKGKQKIKEYNESEKGKKKNQKTWWKKIGLVWTSKEEIDEIYSRYLASEKCEKCNEQYTKKNVKDMDHEHSLGKYGAFRNILCHRCNSNDKSSNTSGTPNVHKHKDGWAYKKTTNKIIHSKFFKTKQEAIDYKILYES